jgi:hypothetical protein
MNEPLPEAMKRKTKYFTKKKKYYFMSLPCTPMIL